MDKRAAKRAAYREIALLVETCLPVADPVIDWRADYDPADIDRIEAAMREIIESMHGRSHS